MQPNELILQILLPEQTLKKLSFCSSNKPQRVAEWASLLRPTQIATTSAMLYQALPELNQLDTNMHARFDMLEALRPYVQDTISGLSKSFLHQPISLPPEAQKSAVIAQALQKHMVDGYLLCIRDTVLGKRTKGKQDPKFITALHRAITGIGFLFLRSYQIYTQPPKGVWQTLHNLFQLADQYEVLDQRLPDDVQRLAKVSSIQSAYLRIILLATARPHQLSQNNVAAIYDAFGEWAELLRFTLDLSDDPDCFFYVNLRRDAGPLYKSRVGSDEQDDLLIELNFKQLMGQLTKQSRESLDEINNNGFTLSKEISTSLLDHLLDTWGNIPQRKHDRREAQMTADIGVGLTDCHYFICSGQDFETFLRSSASTSEIENASRGGFTPRDAFASTSQNFDKPVNRVEVQNISQSGYCLLWKSNAPIRVESGDLVTIKEYGKRVWTVGVVRWIRQKKQASQLGVQVLSDKAQPYAIALTYDMGGYSDYMRALFLPQSQFTDDPPTLITPSAPFQEYDRVRILDGKKTLTAKLDERIFSTGSIQQFSFHAVDSATADKHGKSSGKGGGWG